MKRQADLARQTAEYMRAGRLTRPGELLLAAVSGGRDSCVMLDILQGLHKELGFSLAVAHFDHQLRGESAAEQRFVSQLAARYGLPFFAGSADIRAISRGKNIEDTARRERYAFLRQAAAEAGAQKIATAHHAQDQAETLLLHLLRGCGLPGLAAMAPLAGEIMRPLLFALPEQIEEYRAAQELEFCQDQSNFSPLFLRNRLRLELLPQLAEINPRLVESLSATAEICREDNTLLNVWAQVALQELWRAEEQAVGAGFFELPPALQRRIARLAFARATGAEQELSFAQTEALRALKEEQSASLPGGWLAWRRGDLWLGRAQPPLPQYDEIIPLTADGAWHELAAWGWRYAVGAAGEYSITLPAEWAEKLAFRTRREGDAVPSRGQAGRRKLKDIFIAAKIAPYRRAGWPLLLHGEEIIWLPGLYHRALEISGPTLTVTLQISQ